MYQITPSLIVEKFDEFGNSSKFPSLTFLNVSPMKPTTNSSKKSLLIKTLCTVFIRIEAWAFISYKRLLSRRLYEPFPHFI